MQRAGSPDLFVRILLPPELGHFLTRTDPNVGLGRNVRHEAFERHEPARLADEAVVQRNRPCYQ